MPAFLVLIYVVALGAWLVAAVSAVSIVGLAPPGSRFTTLNELGWWRFGAIEARVGPSVRAPIARYRKAFLAFFLCVLAGMATGLASIPTTAPAG